MSEEWRSIPGYEGYYEVSDLGRIRSLHRNPPSIRKTASADRYYGINLARDGQVKRHSVHVLVAMAFHGSRPDGCQAAHSNGDSHDNRASNISWKTVSENNLDRVAHGTHQESRKTHCIRGHEFTPENTQVSIRGRHCRQCGRENHYRWIAEHPEQSAAINRRARAKARKTA